MCDEEGSCDFEQANICGFYNTREEDDFDWTLNQGPTFSANTGYVKNASETVTPHASSLLDQLWIIPPEQVLVFTST